MHLEHRTETAGTQRQIIFNTEGNEVNHNECCVTYIYQTHLGTAGTAAPGCLCPPVLTPAVVAAAGLFLQLCH